MISSEVEEGKESIVAVWTEVYTGAMIYSKVIMFVSLCLIEY